MQIQDHDDFPELDHRPSPPAGGDRSVIGRRPTSRGSPREVDPHREPGENSNGTSGKDHSGINNQVLQVKTEVEVEARLRRNPPGKAWNVLSAPRHFAVICASAKSELRSLAPSEFTRTKISVTSS